jgi:hypothetical protein
LVLGLDHSVVSRFVCSLPCKMSRELDIALLTDTRC